MAALRACGKVSQRGIVLHRSPSLGRGVDFLWPAQMLAVETDFFDYHRGHQAFEDDHERELHLRRLGYTVRRYTGAQLDNYPAEIVAELGEVLSGGSNPKPVPQAAVS